MERIYLLLGSIFLLASKNVLNETGLITLSFLGGFLINSFFGLLGRFSKPPPQFGQTF
jgi:hypothetical protein